MEPTRLDPGDLLAVLAIDVARVSLAQVADELADLRRQADSLESDTAWRSRAAEGYRSAIRGWNDRVQGATGRAVRLDDELRHIAARLTQTGASR